MNTPEFDPLDPTLKNYQPDIDNALDYLAEKDSLTQEQILDFYNENIKARNLPALPPTQEDRLVLLKN